MIFTNFLFNLNFQTICQKQFLPSKGIFKKITRRSREKREGGERPRGRAPKSEAEEKKNLRRGKGKDAAAESERD